MKLSLAFVSQAQVKKMSMSLMCFGTADNRFTARVPDPKAAISIMGCQERNKACFFSFRVLLRNCPPQGPPEIIIGFANRLPMASSRAQQ